MAKQKKMLFPSKKFGTIEKLELVHIDLSGPSRTRGFYEERVENESGVKIKSLRSDRGGEFTSREFNIYCEEHGIKRKLTSP